MSNLIPEQRTDRNGRVVTRHVRKDGAAAKGKIAIPAPVPTNSDKDKRKLLSDLLPVEQGTPGHPTVKQRMIDEMPVELVKATVETLEQHSGSERVVAAVDSILKHWDYSTEDRFHRLRFVGLESYYDRHLVKSPLGNPFRYSDISSGIINDLKDYYDDPDTPELLDKAEVLSHMGAALDLHSRAAGNYNRVDEYTYVTDNPELAGVFLEFPEQLEELTEYVIGNGSNAGAARQYMRGDHLALGDGAL